MSTQPPEQAEGKDPHAAGQPDGKAPGVADQAASDGQDVAKAAIKGALTGGAAGAAKSAAVAAVKSKTGKQIIFGSAAALAVVLALVVSAVFGGISSYGFDEARASVTQEVVEAEVEDATWTKAAKAAGDAHKVDWQLILAIHVMQDQRTQDKGTGPYGIDMGADAVKSAELSEEDAGDLDAAASFIAKSLSAALGTTDTNLDNPSLTSGAEFSTSEEDGFKMAESEDETAKAEAEESKRYHIEALKTLPIKGNPQVAEGAWDTARSWALGKASTCQRSDAPSVVPQTSVDLNEQQKKYALQIVNAVAVRGMDQKAAVIALATVMQESTFRMWWNPKVPGSKELTDDITAEGVDGYSVGLFQQQVNGNAFAWGTVKDAMSPAKSTEMFLEALERIGGWEKMPVTNAAQAVQGSAHPDKYAPWESMATQLAKDFWPGGEPAGHEDVEGGDDAPVFGTREDGSHLTVNPLATMDLKAVEQAVKDNFGSYVYSMGDYRNDGDHAKYRAADLMIADYKSSAGVANGDKIAQFFIDNREVFGIEYLIWQDKIWLGPTEGWKPYSSGGYGGMYAGNWNDTTKHMDHVHVNVFGDKGTGGDLVYNSPDGSDSASGCSSPVGGIGTGEAGKGDDYPYKEPKGVCAWCSNVDAGGAVDPWTLYKRECVSFTAWRINQQMGWKEGQEYPFTPSKLGLPRFGNASEWSGNLTSAGYVTDTNPAPGAIAWWAAYAMNSSITTGAAGHVGIVTAVDKAAGTVTIEQYNAVPWEYSVMTIPIDHVTGFIHVADIKETDGGDAKAEE